MASQAKAQQFEQEAQIAQDMERLRMEELRDEKFRQQVRAQSVELRGASHAMVALV